MERVGAPPVAVHNATALLAAIDGGEASILRLVGDAPFRFADEPVIDSGVGPTSMLIRRSLVLEAEAGRRAVLDGGGPLSHATLRSKLGLGAWEGPSHTPAAS